MEEIASSLEGIDLSLNSLIQEFKSHRPPLRHVDVWEKPTWIGGRKPPPHRSHRNFPSMLTPLQAEFVLRSMQMQGRVRPTVAQLEDLRRATDEGIGLAMVMQELRHRRSSLSPGDRESRALWLKYQIDRQLQERPGWCDLMQQVRHPESKLDPVEWQGFYIVRQCSGKSSRSFAC